MGSTPGTRWQRGADLARRAWTKANEAWEGAPLRGVAEDLTRVSEEQFAAGSPMLYALAKATKQPTSYADPTAANALATGMQGVWRTLAGPSPQEMYQQAGRGELAGAVPAGWIRLRMFRAPYESERAAGKFLGRAPGSRPHYFAGMDRMTAGQFASPVLGDVIPDLRGLPLVKLAPAVRKERVLNLGRLDPYDASVELDRVLREANPNAQLDDLRGYDPHEVWAMLKGQLGEHGFLKAIKKLNKKYDAVIQPLHAIYGADPSTEVFWLARNPMRGKPTPTNQELRDAAQALRPRKTIGRASW
jgi:hypothetical protein